VIEPRLLQKLHHACSLESRKGQSLPLLRHRARDFLAGISANAGWDLPELAGRALFALGFNNDREPDLVLPAATAIDGFLRSVLPDYPRPDVLAEKYPRLKELVFRPRVSERALVAWYRDFLGM
jgi:hypothetical protein